MKQIPNLFTLLNLVFGCVAIIFILQTGETLVTQNEGTWIAQLPEKIWWGSICIGIAAIIDFLDGFVARLFKAESAIGKELDSLADVVSFGVAPGLIFYQLLRISYISEESGLDTSVWTLLPALLFPCAGAYRLARFNTDPEQQSGFRGVPIPAAGLVAASLPLILLYDYFGLASILLNKWVLYAIIIVLSYLMISNLSLMALKFKDFTFQNNLSKIILIVLSIVAVIFLQWLAVPVIFILYILLSLAFKNKIA
ncbi:MAG: CDP-alcohol phosphatidyltransferase family protein [Chitinophagaceae bacterium]|nr:CDP-alcohol phosphatidyltransferase family protein [Chitinophagaceae bacterium]